MEELSLIHEIELYPIETFHTLLEHEVNRAKRYKTALTLIHLAVETDESGPHPQHAAEVFTINVLNLQVRDTDIPCKKGNEFLILLPVTDEAGGRITCKRLEKLFQTESQVYDKVSFKLSAYIGMATLAGEKTTSSKRLLEYAEKSLQHARKDHLRETVVYSDIAPTLG